MNIVLTEFFSEGMKTLAFDDMRDDSSTENKFQFDIDSEEEDSNGSSGDESIIDDEEVECSSGSSVVISLVHLASSDSESDFENNDNVDVWGQNEVIPDHVGQWEENEVIPGRLPQISSEESSMCDSE